MITNSAALATNVAFLRFNSSEDTTTYVDYLYNNSPPLLVMSERTPALSRAASANLQRRQTRGDGTTTDTPKSANDKRTVVPTQFVVHQETIRPSVTGLSGLSKLLQGTGVGAAADSLNLLVYLPNRQPLHFKVSKSATVEQTIEKVLKLHNESSSSSESSSESSSGASAAHGGTLLLRGSSACYELRLHEEDGMPEEDFPALERTREVKHFGGEGDHEYCLCQIEGMEEIENEERRKNEAAGGQGKGNGGQAQKSSPVQLPSGKYLKISLPGQLHSTLKKNDPRYHTLRDLIPVLANKQSMPNLYHETVQFEVSKEDCIELNMMSTILDLGTLLVDLKVDAVQLTTKTYADTPTHSDARDSPSTRRERNNTNDKKKDGTSSSVLGRAAAQETTSGARTPTPHRPQRPPETAFRFDALTAAIYQEWPIKKKNKWGRWQTRILGVDIEKMYNKKSSGRGGRERRGSTAGVKNPERLIADILEIEYVEGTTTRFKLKHNEGDTTQTLEYEAETSHDCVEIISKLKYILKRG